MVYVLNRWWQVLFVPSTMDNAHDLFAIQDLLQTVQLALKTWMLTYLLSANQVGAS